MKIAVEIDIPDGEYCTGCDLLVNDYCRNYAGLLTKNLKTKEPVKFLSCIFACQRAEEQQTDLQRVKAERDAAVNELSALKEANRWIPVSKKLPTKTGLYLGWCAAEKAYLPFGFRENWTVSLDNRITS